jgi:hypothetical protein
LPPIFLGSHFFNILFVEKQASPVTMVLFRIATLALLISTAASFAPKTFVGKNVAARTQLKMLDPSVMDVSSINVMMESASQFMAQQSSTLPEIVSTFMDQSSNMLSFADQGQNLAGTFFQASLLPYLLFLYFVSFRANRINNIGNFGFQYILLFVLSTIPSGIISKATYGTSLANVDWLHGGAELLLTVANVLLVRARKGGKSGILITWSSGGDVVAHCVSLHYNFRF